MVSLRDEALKLHADNHGKICIQSKVPVKDAHDLSLAYSPGVAEPCKEIAANQDLAYAYTNKGNMVAVVSNGTAVLGLGDIGAHAAIPVMEGKCILFKNFAGVDAFPLCLPTKDVDQLVETIKLIAPVFGGINLEDIAAPSCFEVEARLKAELDIPVFHDDQHGTAIVTMAGLINALKVVNKELKRIKVVTSGAGAAGIAITKLLLSMGVQDIIMCDRQGTIYQGRPNGMNKYKEEIALQTNRHQVKGSLADALAGADVFIGVSVANALSGEMVRTMANKPIVFALANPTPEIMPDTAKAAGAVVVGTGRSDFPNQVNNVAAFPGIFRGALQVKASAINEAMKVAAAYAIAGLVTDRELNADFILPTAFDPRLTPAVASAVAKAAQESGVARIMANSDEE
ncbi:MAG TPA: malic enzyme-like NAD(P)-binding protein [Desulfobacteria bacterium]|nr:malic enzyme-like NAD(P)-binding protein [Desulfobacteria bacterium]